MPPLAALALCLGAVLEVPAGAPLAPALAAARPGDVVRLGPGTHAGSLGSPPAIRVEGAGAALTRVVAPEGEDGVLARGRLDLAGLSLETDPSRAALRVLGGEVSLSDVALSGGAAGAYLGAGRLEARGVLLRGAYGLLVDGGEALVEESDTLASVAGVAVVAGQVTVRRSALTGPSREAGVTVVRGTARLEAVVIRAPGPTGLSVAHGGTIEGLEVTVAGAVEEHGALGACAEVVQGTLRLEGATLVACAGAALEAVGGEVTLRGTDATGGTAGCLVLVDGAAARLEGNVCSGRGPGLAVVGTSRATLVANRWWTEPAAWVDCAGGAQVEIGRGEALAVPCAAAGVP